jgi:hypothetical protein
MNELMKKYKSNIKVVAFEIMKSSKPHKINPSCSRFCGLFLLNIYVCKVIVVFLSVSCSSIYSNTPSDLNTLGSLPDFVDVLWLLRYQSKILQYTMVILVVNWCRVFTSYNPIFITTFFKLISDDKIIVSLHCVTFHIFRSNLNSICYGIKWRSRNTTQSEQF